MDEIILEFISLEPLLDEIRWANFFAALENRLNDKLSRLDKNDPIRRKVTDLAESGRFVTSFGEREQSRYLFGRFERNKKILLMISLFRGASRFPNRLEIYLPVKILELEGGTKKVLDIFLLCKEFTEPFYAFGDTTVCYWRKKKATGYPIDPEAELPGIFWLTYLDRKYVDYFGQEKINQLSVLNQDENGVTICLGDSPLMNDPPISREEAQIILGADSFVDPNSFIEKTKGEFALTYAQLKYPGQRTIS